MDKTDDEGLILRVSDENLTIELKASNGFFFSLIRDSTLWNISPYGKIPEKVPGGLFRSFEGLFSNTISKYPLFKLNPEYIDPEYKDFINSCFIRYIMTSGDK